jgi:hypothetical protein
MLISDERRLLFVHVQKTGGTSITSLLKAPAVGARDYLRPHDPYRVALHASDHGRHLGYTKVAFVRNPFDRLVSWYSCITSKARLLSEVEKRSTPCYNRLRQYVLEHAATFDDFIVHCAEAQDRSGWQPFLQNQCDYLVDDAGSLAMDFIGRFESLQADFQAMCDLLGLGNTPLPHRNSSSHGKYRSYYTPSTRRIVEERFRRDCEAFGYEF